MIGEVCPYYSTRANTNEISTRFVSDYKGCVLPEVAILLIIILLALGI